MAGQWIADSECVPSMLNSQWSMLAKDPSRSHASAATQRHNPGLSQSTVSRRQVVPPSGSGFYPIVKQGTASLPFWQLWIPIRKRVKFKVLLFTDNLFHGLAPPLLTNLLCPLPNPRSLRSSSQHFLAVSHSRLTKGDRALSTPHSRPL